ncbi:MAG: ATPase, T2SS/T4P/T4SS family [Acetobacteraceae bacterium]|nr:ATPase, T2SS/T4P/T4SS family [Acetobacteraceae bacterium]
MALYSLTFSDLFLPADISGCWYKETAGARDGRSVPDDCREEVAALRALLVRQGAVGGSKVDWEWKGEAPSLRLRIQQLDTVADGPVFVCARPLVNAATLAELGFPQSIAARLLSEEVQDGLVLFMGQTRAGKSTACAAYAVERVTRHGGVCWTAEAPVELPIHGPHGRGQVYQCEVGSEAEFGASIRKFLRASTDFMLIGEVLDDDAAAAAVRASATGHLVTTTFHAASLTGGLERFAGMCGSAANFASALRAAFHLQLRTVGENPAAQLSSIVPGKAAPPKRVLSVTPLIVPGENAEAIRSHIRAGQFHQLASEVDRQRRTFMGAG